MLDTAMPPTRERREIGVACAGRARGLRPGPRVLGARTGQGPLPGASNTRSGRETSDVTLARRRARRHARKARVALGPRKSRLGRPRQAHGQGHRAAALRRRRVRGRVRGRRRSGPARGAKAPRRRGATPDRGPKSRPGRGVRRGRRAARGRQRGGRRDHRARGRKSGGPLVLLLQDGQGRAGGLPRAPAERAPRFAGRPTGRGRRRAPALRRAEGPGGVDGEGGRRRGRRVERRQGARPGLRAGQSDPGALGARRRDETAARAAARVGL
mmetsp:Transcript_31325/g.96946  ORF Transcript_31325/g.96946 Transcript_31325/m.96946 type:complete len:270 (+) Transcript_31325:227-1036(+)